MTAPDRPASPWPLVIAGLVLALLLGMVVASAADPNPDGLERAVIDTQCPPGADEDQCLDDLAGDPVFNGAPLPDYEVTWLSGLVGVVTSFGLGCGLVLLVRRRRRQTPERDAARR